MQWILVSGSGDIVGGNLKLILGLIWTLILHFQIIGLGITDGDQKGKGPKTTPKQALLGYVQVWLLTQLNLIIDYII